jgi:hypothetical protein
MLKKIFVSILVLGFGLSGFWILDPYKGVLWLIFFVLAYPPALAFTAAGKIPAGDLKEIYKIGVSQIPILGGIISLRPGPPANNKIPPKGPDESRKS